MMHIQMSAGRFSKSRLYECIGVAIVALDQAIKRMMILRNVHDWNILPGVDFTLVFNHGISWGLLNDAQMRWSLAFIVFCMVIYLGFCITRRVQKSLPIIPYVLVMAGGLSNTIDRVRYGAVVDYIHFHAYGYSFPVFNIADVCITIGVLGMIWLLWKEES